jgi:hypothetical protein
MSQPIQKELLADRARQSREERHGGLWEGGPPGNVVGRSSGYRCIEKGSMCEYLQLVMTLAIYGCAGRASLFRTVYSQLVHGCVRC